MAIDLTYSSQRSDVWGAYTQRWKEVLWKFHLLVCLQVAVIFCYYTGSFGSPIAWLKGTFIGLVLCGAMAIWPLIRFKPQTRTVSFDENGLTTKIGSQTGGFVWNEIADIEESGDLLLIVGKSQNMLVIPERAFASSADRASSIATVKSWHEAAAKT